MPCTCIQGEMPASHRFHKIETCVGEGIIVYERGKAHPCKVS